jgi:hypothetical protein
MRTILETAPILVSRTLHNSDKLMEGTAYFTATAYEPGEQAPTGMSGEPDARLLSYWRSVIEPGQPLRVHPPYDGLPSVDIPRALVDALPDTARLELSWRWTQNALGQRGRTLSRIG